MSGKNCRLWKGGKPKCIDCKNDVVNIYAKRCVSCYKNNNTGENSSHWQGGITPENTKIRNSSEYKIWRNGVFLKDNYTCQLCGQYGVYFHADHIKPFADFPELRLEINNGRTLCVPCHYFITFNRSMSDINKWCGFKKVSA